jgi:hypothetical protein
MVKLWADSPITHADEPIYLVPRKDGCIHGGAGFTLSWGTAGSIVQLVRQLAARR